MNVLTLKQVSGPAPAMSAIVLTTEGYDNVRQLMRHLQNQTAANQLEIVFVAPDARCVDLPEEIRICFPKIVAVSLGGQPRSTASARAVGVRAATAPLIAMTEEHSHPETDWAEKLIAAYESGPWVAIGPGIVNANPDSTVSWSNFLLEYGQWSDPVPAWEPEHLPGHNCTYRRDMLLAYGENLETMLEAESLIHWDLRAKGHRICMLPAAKTRHWNYSVPFAWLPLRLFSGQLFAGYRWQQQKWTIGKRLVYLLGSPLIPFVRLRRIIAESQLPGRPQGPLLPRLMPLLLLALAVDALGEAVGYLVGPGRSQQRLAASEFYRRGHLNRRDQAKEDAP